MRELTNFDLFCLINEMKYFEGSRLRKIYHTNGELRLAFQTEAGVMNIVVVPPYTMHTASKIRKAETPTAFAMLLRKHLEGKRLQSIEQPNMDRIVLFKFCDATLVVEFFTRNFALLDKEDNIVAVLHPYERSGRVVKCRQKYVLPEMEKIQLLKLPSSLPPRRVGESAHEYLLRNFNISKYYATEIGKALEEIPEQKWLERLGGIVKRLRMPIFSIFKDGSYGIVLTRASEVDRVFPTFSQLLEELYVGEIAEKERVETERELKKVEEKVWRKLTRQREHLAALLAQVESARAIGEKIARESTRIERIIDAFRSLKRQNVMESEMLKQLKRIERGVVGFEKGKIIVELN